MQKKRILAVFLCLIMIAGSFSVTQGYSGELLHEETTELNNSTDAEASSEDFDEITLSLGHEHSAIIKADNSLWMWGANSSGQLGDGTNVKKYSPVKIMDDVQSISLGGYHSGAIKTDGSLWMWGRNTDGQIGDASKISKNTPIKIMENVKSVSLGKTHSAAVQADGSLFVWGSYLSWLPVKIMDDVKSVSLGDHYGAVIKTDGSLWMWGLNDSGQLGDGTTVDKESPVMIMENVKSVSLSEGHSAAIQADGSLWMWGLNNYGQLGNGTTTASQIPIKVMDNVEVVSLGRDHSGAVQTDGSLWIWGDNENGQLGEDNTLISRETPIKILDNIKDISFRYYSSAAVKTDGSLWMWGNNSSGHLGVDVFGYVTIPTLVQVGSDDTNIEDKDKIPIIIVPGIMGSNLYDSDGIKRWAPSVEEISVLFNANGLSYNTFPELSSPNNKIDLNKTNVKEYGANDSAKELVERLCIEFPNRAIYFFSYDFRNSNSISAYYLEKDINDILEMNGSSKVDIVAHSMGGLVTSAYVRENGISKVNKIITCGTPYEGATILLNRALTGSVLGDENKIDLKFMEIKTDMLLYTFGHLTPSTKCTFASLAELAPTKEYYELYSNNWRMTSVEIPDEIKENFEEAKPVVKYHSMSYEDYISRMKIAFGDNLTQAEDFHAYLKTTEEGVCLSYNYLLDLENSYFVVGKGQTTAVTASLNKNATYIGDMGLNLSGWNFENTGDGTVPYLSATANGNMTSLGSDQDGNSRYIEINTNHGGVFGDGAKKETEIGSGAKKSLDYIVATLKGDNRGIESDKDKPKKCIYVRVACPVDITIQKGEEVLSSDKNNRSTITSFGSLEFCGENDDIKLICLEEGQYDISLSGTDEGNMDYSVSYYDENGRCTDEREFLQVPVTDSTVISSSVEQDKKTVLSVDSDNDGKEEQQWIADNGEEAKIYNVYHLTYELNGGTNNSENPESYVEIDDVMILQDPSRIGYTFDGWYEDAKFVNQVTAILTERAEHITLYAKWLSISYTVAFDANGGATSTAAKSVAYDTTYGTLPAPSRSGYSFKGWYTAKSGGTKITAGTKVSLTNNQTLYAQWTANKYTVTINANSGSVKTTSKSVTYASTYGTLPTPTRSGYKFKGWYTAKSGGSKITSSSKVSITKNQTLYAQWAKQYKVMFNANGGSVTTKSKTVAKGYTYSTLPSPTRSKYAFKGWYTKKTGGTKVTKDKKVSLTKNQTLYAQWTKVSVSKGTVSKLTNTSGKKAVVAIKKISGAKGYQVEYSTSKSFENSTKKSMTKASLTLSSLKKGKTYYVRVRGYKTDSKGKKIYGAYSTAKTIVINK